MMVVRKIKEKCKESARMRREKERAEFHELSKLLPLPSSITSQLDKASVIRLTSSYLRMRAAFPQGLGVNWGTNGGAPAAGQDLRSAAVHQQIRELGSLILQTLDGFVFALHRDGKIMYISETASVHLGLPQIDLTGSSIYEYVHPSDHDDLSQVLELSDNELPSAINTDVNNGLAEMGRSFCMRMRCVLPKRNAGLISSGFKAIHCSGYLKIARKPPPPIETNKPDHEQWASYALVAVGHPLLPAASTEVKLTGNSFMFRSNLDLKLHYIEENVTRLRGFGMLRALFT